MVILCARRFRSIHYQYVDILVWVVLVVICTSGSHENFHDWYRRHPYMHAQITSATFYEGIGWKKIGAEFSEAGIRHVAMIKPHGP